MCNNPNSASPQNFQVGPPETWQDVKQVCGTCKVLVTNWKRYSSCDTYCQQQGRVCLRAWEEKANNCHGQIEYACWDKIKSYKGTGTGDALCLCGQLWDRIRRNKKDRSNDTSKYIFFVLEILSQYVCIFPLTQNPDLE